MTKNQVRAIALTRRNNLTQDQIQTCSHDISSQIINSQQFQNAKIVHIYKSFGTEVDTAELIQKAFEQKKIVVLPEVCTDQNLRHWQVFPDTVYVKDKLGIETPSDNCMLFEPVNLKRDDLVLVPIVAFDSHNNRIGYGKGFYDKFLKNLVCKKIGIAFGCQIVEDFEPDPWDVTLDQIIQNQKT
jgi:5-formyltetrahydrofolate cyclo-ligase